MTLTNRHPLSTSVLMRWLLPAVLTATAIASTESLRHGRSILGGQELIACRGSNQNKFIGTFSCNEFNGQATTACAVRG